MEIQKITINNSDFKIYGTLEKPLFLVKDIAKILEHSNPSMLAQVVDEDDLSECYAIDSLNRSQLAKAVTEQGLYQILLRSDHPNAKPFRKKVSEVLVEIRKTGKYEVETMDEWDRMIQQSKQITAILERQKATQDKLAEVERLAIQANSYNSANTNFMTIRGYCNIHKLKMDLKQAQQFGKLASKIAKKYGIVSKKAIDEAYGEVGSYPVEVLDEAYNEMYKAVAA